MFLLRLYSNRPVYPLKNKPGACWSGGIWFDCCEKHGVCPSIRSKFKRMCPTVILVFTDEQKNQVRATLLPSYLVHAKGPNSDAFPNNATKGGH